MTREPSRGPAGGQAARRGTLEDAPAPPVRTCVGCGGRESARNLLRWVAREGILVLDLRKREPGRGAWLHPSSDCLETARRRRSFARALRGRVDTDGAEDQFNRAVSAAPLPTESGLEADGHPMSTQR